MDFITYEPSAAGYWLVGLLVLGVVLFLGSLLLDGPGPVTLVGIILIVAAFMVGIIVPSGVEGWSKDVRAEIKDHYGVTLSEKQFEKLKYPKLKEEPEGNFEQYGSVTVVKPDGDRGFEKTEVYLLWSDGEMVLAYPDEQKKLQPLKSRD